jgi:hypothetical protein
MPILKDEKGMVLFRLIGKGMVLASLCFVVCLFLVEEAYTQ